MSDAESVPIGGASRSQVLSALRSGPFDRALRVAIKARGLSLERLRLRLLNAGSPVGLATLSSWQSGRRRPERPESLIAVEVLERVLEVPAGSLTALLGAPRRRGPGPRRVAAPRPFPDILDLGEPVVALADRLNWQDSVLRVVNVWDIVHVAAGSCLTSFESFVVLEAVRETDRYVTVHHGAPGIDLHTTVRFEAVTNCRVGRVCQDADHPLILAELMFDRPVAAGETAIVHFRVTDSSGSADTEFCRFVRAPAQHVAVVVRFAADAVPKRCWRFVRERQGWPDQLHKDIELSPFNDVHFARGPVPPGFTGIGWEP